MENELKELLGEVDADTENECQRCHQLYMLREGEEPTKYCDHCAQEIAEEVDDPPR